MNDIILLFHAKSHFTCNNNKWNSRPTDFLAISSRFESGIAYSRTVFMNGSGFKASHLMWMCEVITLNIHNEGTVTRIQAKAEVSEEKWED